MNKILILGNFGYANHDLSGQTIKTRVTKNLLVAHYGKTRVRYFDMQTLRQSRFNVFKMLYCIASCRHLVYLPAHGNLKYLFPLIFIMSWTFRFDIIYSVIGGWLVLYLRNKPLHRWMLKRIRVIFAETRLMKEELAKEYGFKNVEILNNFRITDFTPKPNQSSILKLVFMARVEPQKGLDVILNFCEYISSLSPQPEITIDFYGPLTDNAKDSGFIEKIAKIPFANYVRELEPEEIYSVLQNYDASLLPTHFYTEGLPGSVIDSYIAGIPIIATEWLHSHEFIDHGETGFIVDFNNPQRQFNESIMLLYKDRNKLARMKFNATAKSQLFRDKIAYHTLQQFLHIPDYVIHN